MVSVSTKPLNPPRTINQFMREQWAAAIVGTSASLKIFDVLDSSFQTPAHVAQKCGIQEKGAELILNALAGMNLLEKKDDKFKTTEEAHHYLVSDSPLYVGKFFEMRPWFQEAWQNLPNVLRTGSPHAEVNKDDTAEKFFPELATALFPVNYACAEKLADALKIADLKEKTCVLDLACGSAVWSIPMAKSNKNVVVDALDFPAVLDATTKPFAEKHGVADQFKYLPGNWTETKLEDGVYDVVILGHILHSEGKARSVALLDYVHNALKKGGTVAVGEFLVDDTRTNPAPSAMFAVNMYLLTTEGCVFSQSELSEMLLKAGFANVRSLPKEKDDTDVVLADKK